MVSVLKINSINKPPKQTNFYIIKYTISLIRYRKTDLLTFIKKLYRKLSKFEAFYHHH